MRMADILWLRDEAIKNELFSMLPPEGREHLERVVERAFEHGARFWEKEQFPVVAGEEEWDAFVKSIPEIAEPVETAA